jgi:cell division protein FtsQ
MKSMVKKIFLTVAVVLCCGAVVVGGAWCSNQRDDSPCSTVNIIVNDSLQRQFVDADELNIFLKRNGCFPAGKSMSAIDCHALEQCLLQHDMVRTASCYKSPFQTVYIHVTQRVPLLSVVSDNGCYYVDTDRRVMPVRARIDAELPVFKGNISQRAATEEYFDFVEWLNGNHYWRERIKDVQVSTPKHVVLNLSNHPAKVILGSLDDYENKLAKLKKLYTKGLDKIGYPDYREYDLRFDGQVVARK